MKRRVQGMDAIRDDDACGADRTRLVSPYDDPTTVEVPAVAASAGARCR